MGCNVESDTFLPNDVEKWSIIDRLSYRCQNTLQKGGELYFNEMIEKSGFTRSTNSENGREGINLTVALVC